jgi:predicted RNA-binding protein with PUA-like domain
VTGRVADTPAGVVFSIMTKPSARRFWLLKTEPGCFSFDDLLAAPRRTTHWSGVRNYQARNFMRDEMKKGDGVLFYHSSADPTGIVGTAEVVREGYPDFTSWDANDEHFDPRSSAANPIWFMVDIRAGDRFRNFLSLSDLRHVRALEKMELLRRGSRLSVQPVRPAEWAAVLAMGAAE